MRRSRMRVSIFMTNLHESMGPGTSLMEHKFLNKTSQVALKPKDYKLMKVVALL